MSFTEAKNRLIQEWYPTMVQWAGKHRNNGTILTEPAEVANATALRLLAGRGLDEAVSSGAEPGEIASIIRTAMRRTIWDAYRYQRVRMTVDIMGLSLAGSGEIYTESSAVEVLEVHFAKQCKAWEKSGGLEAVLSDLLVEWWNGDGTITWGGSSLRGLVSWLRKRSPKVMGRKPKRKEMYALVRKFMQELHCRVCDDVALELES